MGEVQEFLWQLKSSEEVRAYIRETGREFTDFEKASIIYRSNIPFEKKRAELLLLQNSTEDKLLKQQLRERIAYDEKCMELYANNSEGYVYVLFMYADEVKREIIGYFGDSDLAYFRGEKLKSRFKIEKHRLLDSEDMQTEEFNDSVAAWLLFDEKGELISYDSEEVRAEDVERCSSTENGRYARFENTYIDIPDFFGIGNIV